MTRNIWASDFVPEPRLAKLTVDCNDRDDLIHAAKAAAGYGYLDTPCEARRSAYTEDATGERRYFLAQDRWELYRDVMLTRQDLCWSGDLDLCHRLEDIRCDQCGRSDDHVHCDACGGVLPDHVVGPVDALVDGHLGGLGAPGIETPADLVLPLTVNYGREVGTAVIHSDGTATLNVTDPEWVHAVRSGLTKGLSIEPETTDWPAFAADLLLGDPEVLRARLPEWLRPVGDAGPQGVVDAVLAVAQAHSRSVIDGSHVCDETCPRHHPADDEDDSL